MSVKNGIISQCVSFSTFTITTSSCNHYSDTKAPFSAVHKFTLKTRKSANIFGLGNAITKENSIITGAHLPMSLQLLRCLMFYVQEGASTN